MTRIHSLIAVCMTVCLAVVARADTPLAAGASASTVDALGYAREMPPGAPMGAAYLHLRNRGDSARTLAHIALPGHPGARIELHTTQQVNGVSKMRPVKEISVPGNGTLEMRPGATHLMVHGVRLKAGDTLELQLIFVDGGSQKLKLPVLGLNDSLPAGISGGEVEEHHHHHHGHG